MAKRRSPRPEHAAPAGGSAVSMPVLNGAPWYVKLVIWMLIWFGFPVALASYLLLERQGVIPSQITAMAHELTLHRSETAEVVKFVQMSTRLQRQICRNTAKDPVERVFCDQ